MIQSLGLELPTFSELRKEREREAAREESRRTRTHARSYEAARLNRLTKDFTAVPTSTNFELRRDLRTLRARAKWLARNDDYVKRFLSMVRSNVAGPAGVRLQARARNSAGELDRVLNRAVETAWAAWSHPENCSASGRLSWAEAQRKAIGMVARDGEVLVRMVAADNPFGFALKVYSADWLDETFCQINSQTGNRIIMSVEVDDDDRPVTYWLTTPQSELLFRRSQALRTPVPAAEMIHLFLADDENADDDSQTRGVPWLHTAIKRLKILNGYEEAELIAARIGACKMGFFTEDSAEDEYAGEEDGERSEAFPLMESAQPGTFGVLPAGMDFKEFSPDHPNGGYEQFLKAVLRGIASGLDVTPFSLTGDLSDVNYSSARIGLLQERDVWQALQNFLVEHFCRPIFLAWLKSAMLAGAVKITAADYRRLAEPQWQPRGWKWVDPLKEVQAKVIAINNGLETRTGAHAEQGGDFEEALDTLAHEQKMVKEKGVKLLAGDAKKPSANAAPEGEEDS